MASSEIRDDDPDRPADTAAVPDREAEQPTTSGLRQRSIAPRAGLQAGAWSPPRNVTGCSRRRATSRSVCVAMTALR